jgi:peptidyl-prolyl cis-trans isomerase C
MSPLNSTFIPVPSKRTWGMKFMTLAALALLSLPVVSGCSKDSGSSSQSAAANPDDPTIVRVNGVEIRQSDLTLAEEDLGSELQGPPDQKREQLISYLSDIVLVSQEADKRKMADDPEFKRRQALMRNKLLMGALLQAHGKAAATEEEMRKIYEEQVKPMGAEEEVHARHILVETEDEAKAIVEQIKGGADFATLAKEKSKDTGSAGEGGDLGYFVKGRMVPEFAEVAFKMYPGQVSNPVKTQFGWHVIKVEDKRSRPVPEFDQVKPQIEAYLARRAQTELVAQLRESAKVERLDKPATPPAPAAAPAPAPKK